MGGLNNYKFGQKNNWRRTIWNEISRRVGDTKDAIVLYLAGEQDLDRKVAIEKGFKSDNLIVVENDKVIVKKLRGQGKIVIHADMNDVLFGWNDKGPIVDVIYGDFCSGFEPRTSEVHDVVSQKIPFMDSVVMMNFQRGRDPRSNNARSLCDEISLPEFHKHRGYQFLMTNCIELLNIAKFGTLFVYGKEGRPSPGSKIRIKEPSAMDRIILERIFNTHGPILYSYKSGVLTMDSIIFQSHMRNSKTITRKMIAAAMPKCEGDKIDRAKKQVAAALAIRTMKLGGKLEHSPMA